jgi:hypothetical protein
MTEINHHNAGIAIYHKVPGMVSVEEILMTGPVISDVCPKDLAHVRQGDRFS